jgi:hypothetical protein
MLVGSCSQTFWNTLSVPSSTSQAVTEEDQETFTCLLHSSLTAFPYVILGLLNSWTLVKLPIKAAKDAEEEDLNYTVALA